MKRCVLLFEIVTFMLIAGFGCAIHAQSDDLSHFTGGQIKHLARTAKTEEDFTQIANYYWARQREYNRKAHEELIEWGRRNGIYSPAMEKWPRPVDSARNLYEYYRYEEAQSARLFAKYSKMADDAAGQ